MKSKTPHNNTNQENLSDNHVDLMDTLMNLDLDENILTGSLGIDFGTTSCMVAWKADKDSDPCTPYGMEPVPSLFWRTKDGQELVADEVSDRLGIEEDPEGVSQSVKMHLKDKEITLNGHSYKPRYIAIQEAKRAFELSKQAFDEEFIDISDVKSIVCGEPVKSEAALRGEKRQIIKAATGLEVSLVPEPILGAIAVKYFMDKKGGNNKPILVYDAGGGTVDISVIQPNPKPSSDRPYPFVVLSFDGTDHRNPSAGDRLDEIMAHIIIGKLQAKLDENTADTLKNKKHSNYIRLLSEARKAKERLSKLKETTVAISAENIPTLTTKVTREEFEKEIRPLMQTLADMAYNTMLRANLGRTPDIDIVLIGATTYVPLVKQVLAEKFHWLDSKSIMQKFPEKAVALGRAIYGQRPEIINSLTSYGYAIKVRDLNDSGKEALRTIIPVNSQLPAEVRLKNLGTTVDESSDIHVDIYEVEYGRDEGRILPIETGAGTQYSATHEFPYPVSRGTPVEFKAQLSKDGILTITLGDYLTGSKDTVVEFDMNNTIYK